MTTHIPECPVRDGTDSAAVCICDRLHACEQRVTERWESLRGWGESYAYKTGSDNGFDVGYAAGLDAAREAVMQALGPMDCEDPDQYLTALSAIDALREKP